MAKKEQRGNQKLSIKEGQTTQWSQDTKEVIRSRRSKKDRQYNGQKDKQRSTKHYIEN